MLSKINHTQVPNDFLDTWMCRLSPKTSIVFLAICRKTIGWHKDTDFISVSQIMELTGLSKNGVVSSIKELEEVGLILKESNTIGNVSLPNTYTINFSDGVGQDMHGGGSRHDRGGGSRHDPTKEIVLNKITKEKDTRTSLIKNEELFNEFWDKYDKKTEKVLAIKAWNKLSKDQCQQAIDNITPYLSSLSDKKYQKKPSNYLSHGTYEDNFSPKQPAFKDYG